MLINKYAGTLGGHLNMSRILKVVTPKMFVYLFFPVMFVYFCHKSENSFLSFYVFFLY